MGRLASRSSTTVTSPTSTWRDLTTRRSYWTDDVLPALLASDVRVASVVTLRDALDIVSRGNADARLIAAATDALTKTGEWVWELPAADGAGLGFAISNTIRQRENRLGLRLLVG